ncbi:MAG: hypothetical protein ACRCWF_12945 [Beijerinckiaceae bacterium]
MSWLKIKKLLNKPILAIPAAILGAALGKYLGNLPLPFDGGFVVLLVFIFCVGAMIWKVHK